MEVYSVTIPYVLDSLGKVTEKSSIAPSLPFINYY